VKHLRDVNPFLAFYFIINIIVIIFQREKKGANIKKSLFFLHVCTRTTS